MPGIPPPKGIPLFGRRRFVRHFLVKNKFDEFRRTGAAVYSFPRERNWVENGRAETIGRLEMAILDALSRHSAHPLVGFASEQASAQLGFLRELSAAELEQQIRENEQKLMARLGQWAFPSGILFPAKTLRNHRPLPF